MAFLSFFMPLGRAFNIGTFFPILILPVCVYICLRSFKVKFPTPIFCALASLTYLYNESFSMWGGNVLSTLAGQFAYVYAIDFFLLGLGVMHWEIRKKQWPFLSIAAFAIVALSHFYIALLIPLAVIYFLIFDRPLLFKEKIGKILALGMGAFALSCWFVVPLFQNAPWTTAYALTWSSANLFNEVLPNFFWHYLFFSVIGIYFLWKEKTSQESYVYGLCFFLAACCFGFYFLFPKIGLVDVRLMPYLQLSLVIMGAIAVSQITQQKFWNRKLYWPLNIIVASSLLFWGSRQINLAPGWMNWNYSGWEKKQSYPQLIGLSKKLNGSFSDGRVIYEHNMVSESAGTIRVFEMLPFFARRSTYESVYMQANILAPQAFYLQALVSKTPSCPYSQFICPAQNLTNIKDYMKLMAIQDLILITPSSTDVANKMPELESKGKFPPWEIFSLKEKVSYVEVPDIPPEYIEPANYKNIFFDWFVNYNSASKFQIATKQNANLTAVINESFSEKNKSGSKKCVTSVDVQFDQVQLDTTCPGQFHVLKFAYHPTWAASNNEELYLTSPGFIGIIPKQSTVTLKWGQSLLWKICDFISWVSFFIWVGLAFWYEKKKASN